MGFMQSVQEALPGLFTTVQPRSTVDHASQWDPLVNAYLEAYQDGNLTGGLGVAAVYRARQMNATTVAALPLRVNGQKVPGPNTYQTWNQFVTEVILAMQDFGEAYVYVTGNQDLSVLPNRDVTVTWNVGQTKRIYERTGSGVRFREDPTSPLRNLIVIAMNRGADDLTGYGPMESPAIAGYLAHQNYINEYFQNSGMPSGVLEAPGVPTQEEAQRMLKQWVDARQSRAPAVTSSGITWRPMSFNPTDSQYVEGHLANLGDIASLFGVPSHFLSYAPQGSALTYTNVQDLNRMYWLQTLWPIYAYPILLAVADVMGQPVSAFEFDTETLFLPGMAERAQAASVLVAAGYDPDDVADVVGLPPMSTVEVESDSRVSG